MFPALVQTLIKICDSSPPERGSGDAGVLLHSINFEFLVCLEMSTPVFIVTATASNLLQQQDLDSQAAFTIIDGILKNINDLKTEKQFNSLYQNAVQQANDTDIKVPDKIPGQSRQRKVPTGFRDSLRSTTEDQPLQNLEEFYRLKVYNIFLDSLDKEIRRRFKGKDEEKTGKILKSLHSLVLPLNWKAGGDLESSKVQNLEALCKFYGFEKEDKLLTELKVFHSSYTFQKNNLMSTLNCIKENNVHLVFPVMYELLKIFATLPVTTASVERSFSKLKLIKNRLRSLCGEERLFVVMLLSIEKDIPIDNEEVINIFKLIANRRLLL